MWKPIRVSLSGSGFRFPALIGALAAVYDNGFKPIQLVGTSGGAIVAALLASGMEVYGSGSGPDMIGLMRCFPKQKPLLHYSPLAIFNMGLCNGKRLTGYLANYLGELKFKDMKIDLLITAADISRSELVIFSRDRTPEVRVLDAVRASIAVPFLYTPVKYQERWLVDGGVCNGMPIEYLKSGDEVLRLGLKLVSSQPPLSPGIKFFPEILERTIALLMASSDNAHIDFGRITGAIFSLIDTGSTPSFEPKLSPTVIERLFTSGYEKTAQVLKAYQHIAFTNQSRAIHLSGASQLDEVCRLTNAHLHSQLLHTYAKP
jgi:NTE family protein